MPRRILRGKIVSDKMDKTVVVEVERRYAHPLYGKYISAHKKYQAHDENNEYKTGETVSIRETRPLSKKKTFEVIKEEKKRAN